VKRTIGTRNVVLIFQEAANVIQEFEDILEEYQKVEILTLCHFLICSKQNHIYTQQCNQTEIDEIQTT
jgi:hypothetical protein